MLPFELRQEIDFFSNATSSRALLNPLTLISEQEGALLLCHVVMLKWTDQA